MRVSELLFVVRYTYVARAINKTPTSMSEDIFEPINRHHNLSLGLHPENELLWKVRTMKSPFCSLLYGSVHFCDLCNHIKSLAALHSAKKRETAMIWSFPCASTITGLRRGQFSLSKDFCVIV